MNLPRLPLHRWRAAAPLAALLLSLSLPVASFAVLPPCSSGLGTRVIALGGPVTVRILAPDADFTSQIFVVKPGTVGEFRFPLGSSQDVGASVSAGTFSAGRALRFLIEVDETGYLFSTGPASRNLDGLAHARVTQLDEDTVRVEFEDFLGASDRDFDDVVFEVDGAHPQIYFAGLPAEPGELSKLGCDPAGDLVVSPIQVGGDWNVELSLGGAQGWLGFMGPLSHPSSGGELAVSVNASTGQAIFRGSVSHDAQDVRSIRANFLDAGENATYEVTGYLGGQIVASFPFHNGEAAIGLYPVGPFCIEYVGTDTYLNPDGTVDHKVERYVLTFNGRQLWPTGEIGDVEIDTLEFRAINVDHPARSLGSIDLHGAGLDPSSITGMALLSFDRFHTALGQTEFHPTADSLALSELGTSGNDGVSIDLGPGVETFESAWKPLPLVGLSLAGSQIDLASRGTFGGQDDHDLGTLRLLQADGKVRVEADYSAVGSPTHRILILDHGTVVADVRAHSGIVAHLTAWPAGAGKGSFQLPDLTRTPCFSLPLPPDTWIDVPNGPKVLGDRVLVLAESAGPVGGVSRFDLRASGLPAIEIAGEQVTLEPIPPVPAVCVPSATRLCLGDGKFAAEVTWRDAAGRLRASQAVPLTREAGFFRFADPARPEVAVKLFDGRAINGHWWLYEGGLSRRGYRLTVIDLERGTRKVYDHPRGRFKSRVDERAFAASGEERSTSRLLDLGTGEISIAGKSRIGGCVPSGTRLCLAAGRFEVEVVSRGGVGVPRTTASTVPLGDAAGYFFFSEAANAEVFVKALPKREGGWAIVRGSLTKSPYELRVRDRETGEVRTLR